MWARLRGGVRRSEGASWGGWRRGGGPQLVRAMVSITCSSLLRSLCRRANSSFCSADRICRGGNDLRLECFHGLVGSYLVGLWGNGLAWQNYKWLCIYSQHKNAKTHKALITHLIWVFAFYFVSQVLKYAFCVDQDVEKDTNIYKNDTKSLQHSLFFSELVSVPSRRTARAP